MVSGDFYLVIDKDYNILEFRPLSFSNFKNISLDIAKKFSFWFSKETIKLLLEKLYKAKKTKKIEFIYNSFFYEIYFSFLSSDKIFLYFKDISKRKKIEKKLTYYLKKYKAIANAAKDGIIVIDSKGRAILYNVAAEKLFGYKKKEVLGKDIHLLLAPSELHEAYRKGFTKFSESGKGRVLGKTLELEAISKTGERIPIELSVSAFKFDNKFYAVGIIRDIKKRKELEKYLTRILIGIIKALSKIIEIRDWYTAGHQKRVTNLAIQIAKKLNLPEERIKALYLASILHDIGKIAIPMGILNKPGSLTEKELEIIKTHPEVAYNILREINLFPLVEEIVYQHHERLDGSGYPRGLREDQILLEAKILAVADVIEAMCYHRPYRPALGIDKAIEEISKKAGILYDSRVVEICKEFYKKGKLLEFMEKDVEFFEIFKKEKL